MSTTYDDDLDHRDERGDELTDDELAEWADEARDRRLGWLMLVGGLIGAVAAFTLVIERMKLLADPSYVPSCSFNPVLSCGSVMQTDQASVFGFSNPLIGLAAFPVVAAVGAALLGGARLSRWYWAGLQVGVVLGIAFVGWLVVQSIYVIGALCPYCMVVWAVMIPLAWHVTLRNAEAGVLGEGVARSGAVRFLRSWSLLGIVLVYLVVVAMITEAFWWYWSTLG
ncbi:vitamin K epoxide reductase family protein [Nocardioides alkalitolerans]|uniref:vitamin K epoxide reductase family protein n=1 Tax=Nocardioides alkalitolerans TaxID=281714 RepID=UPI000416ABC1|nr:vitamin K epoxide reductase family protein [Nocardioides alkalitolerans]